MNRRMFALALAFVTQTAFGGSFICIPEAGALVEDGDGRPISSHLANVSQSKYILSNSSGDWVLKAHGDEVLTLDNCYSEYFCESKSGYAGTFFRQANSSIFTLIRISSLSNRNQIVAMKGHCSPI